MDTTGAKLISTHMLLPAWWVRAYDVSLLGEQAGLTAVEQALKARLAPALSPLEMGALASVIGTMQEQILTGSFEELRIDLARHVKEAGAGLGAKTRRFAYEKIVQLLTSVKILEPSTHGVTGHPVFASDRWSLPGASEKDVAVTLNPAKNGIECLLGLSDAHADLLSSARGEKPAHIPLGHHAPLMVWKSLWLELTSTEPLLYLRLERAMQWEFRWLQLDGTFGLPLAQLFRGLESDLKQQLKILTRLGRRFAGHGYISPSKSDQYLAFSREDDLEPMLVWQIGRERLASEALDAFRSLAQKALISCHFGVSTPAGRISTTLAWEKLVRLFLPKECSLEEVNLTKKLWADLFQATYDATKPADFPTMIEGLEHRPSQLLSPVLLFFELLLRSKAEETTTGKVAFPVPEVLVRSPLGSLFSPQNPESLRDRLSAFSQILNDSPELIQAFRTEPLATWTSLVSMDDPHLRSFLEERGTFSASHEGMAKPLVVVSRESADGARSVSPATKPTEKVAAHTTEKEPSHEPTKTTGRSLQETTNKSSTSRMLKIAADELQKIKKSHPDQYAALKKAYLESLDEGGRKLIYDVQKRMQAHLFEEHLRQRLLRFMVEHPGAWRSAEASYAKNP